MPKFLVRAICLPRPLPLSLILLGSNVWKDRLTSYVPKVCCAFELLRLDNYLLQPTIDNVRALALLCGIVRDQANPAASWSLLGTIPKLLLLA